MTAQISTPQHPLPERQHYQPETDIPRSSIAFLIKRAYGLLLDLTEPALAAQGLTFIQYIILMRLRDGMALTPKDICTEYRHNGGALTRACDRLTERGLLERHRDGKDRRKVNLCLTAAGRNAAQRLIPVVMDTLHTGIGDFSGSEMREFTRLLLKFTANLQSGLEPARVAAAADLDEKHV